MCGVWCGGGVVCAAFDEERLAGKDECVIVVTRREFGGDPSVRSVESIHFERVIEMDFVEWLRVEASGVVEMGVVRRAIGGHHARGDEMFAKTLSEGGQTEDFAALDIVYFRVDMDRAVWGIDVECIGVGVLCEHRRRQKTQQ